MLFINYVKIDYTKYIVDEENRKILLLNDDENENCKDIENLIEDYNDKYVNYTIKNFNESVTFIKKNEGQLSGQDSIYYSRKFINSRIKDLESRIKDLEKEKANTSIKYIIKFIDISISIIEKELNIFKNL